MNGRKRILVLDSDTDLLITLQGVLEDSGFSSIATQEVDEATDLLATHYFDFFVVGNRPPKINARHMIHDIRERGIQCGCYVIGAEGLHKDGLSNLIDCVQAYPCSTQTPARYLLNSGYAHEALAGMGHGN